MDRCIVLKYLYICIDLFIHHTGTYIQHKHKHKHTHQPPTPLSKMRFQSLSALTLTLLITSGLCMQVTPPVHTYTHQLTMHPAQQLSPRHKSPQPRISTTPATLHLLASTMIMNPSSLTGPQHKPTARPRSWRQSTPPPPYSPTPRRIST